MRIAFHAALFSIPCRRLQGLSGSCMGSHQPFKSRYPMRRVSSTVVPCASASSDKVVPESSSSSRTEIRTHVDIAKTFVIALCIGIAGSTVGSLIGAGGGVVVTPLLTFLGLSQHSAHGTSLCVITVTAAMSALRYAKGSQLRIYAALMLASGAMFSAPLGARFSARVNGKALKRYFGMFLLFVSLLIPTMPHILASTQRASLPLAVRNVLLACIGVCTGFLSGLLGIGGGTINVPALVLIAGFSQKLAQGTALLAMLVPSIFASASHAKLKQVRFDFLPGLVLGAVVGATIGSELALFLPENSLRILCSSIFFLIGLRYLAVVPKKKTPETQ